MHDLKEYWLRLTRIRLCWLGEYQRGQGNVSLPRPEQLVATPHIHSALLGTEMLEILNYLNMGLSTGRTEFCLWILVSLWALSIKNSLFICLYWLWSLEFSWDFRWPLASVLEEKYIGVGNLEFWIIVSWLSSRHLKSEDDDSHLLFPKTKVKSWFQSSEKSALQVIRPIFGEQKGLDNFLTFEKSYNLMKTFNTPSNRNSSVQMIWVLEKINTLKGSFQTIEKDKQNLIKSIG